MPGHGPQAPSSSQSQSNLARRPRKGKVKWYRRKKAQDEEGMKKMWKVRKTSLASELEMLEEISFAIGRCLESPRAIYVLWFRRIATTLAQLSRPHTPLPFTWHLPKWVPFLFCRLQIANIG
ncbi:hypothetical protein AYX13_03683 [Cryptococcus neoformans]|nr:hypothetical protein AYX13_03683 [Cryptococcus neoformans var. grubii]